MEVKCYNKKCLYIWFYRGKNKRFICCPKCRYKRILDKCRAFFLNKNDIQKRHTQRHTSNRPNDIQLIKPKIEFETIRDQDGFVYLVDKRIAKQFKEGFFQEEEVQEEESAIRILPSKFKIIKIIPRDPIKILQHQQEYGLRIAN